MKIKSPKYPYIITAIFIVIYSLVVFVNHYNFRTYALDLGVFTNALYDYSHLQWNDATVFKYHTENLLSDHFDLYLIIFSPLSYVFGNYTLLIIQITSVIIGAWGVYKYLLLKFNKEGFAALGMLHFCLFFGIYSALSFDYHSNVVAAMLAPWLFYFSEKKYYVKFGLLFLWMILAKETISLWCFCICLGLIIQYWKDKKAVIILSCLALISVSYFLILVKVVMPHLAASGQYDHFKYHILGENINSAVGNILKHPFNTLQNLFVNHSGNLGNDWYKTEFYAFALVSGGLLLFFRPSYLIMLLSPIAVKMFNDNPTIWAIDCHYSVEFASIITVGAFTVLGENITERFKSFFGAFFCIGSGLITYKHFNKTIFYHPYERMNIFNKNHYSQPYNVSKVHEAFKLIHDTATIAVQSPFVPHLAYRNNCFTLPHVKHADYIFASKSEQGCYPISYPELRQLLKDTIASNRWQVIADDSTVTILKKKPR